jgi:nucleosome assembly protein 1-like 1
VRLTIEDTGFETEYSELKYKYDTQYFVLYNEISKIVRGESSPAITSEEAERYGLDTAAEVTNEGIPDYWRKVLKNSNYFTINEKDELILEFLRDVRLVPIEGKKLDFTMEFEFRPNEYFTNTLLTKSFFHDSKTDDVEKTVGSSITWASQDKNPRIAIKNKKVKKGKKIEVKKTETIVPSFFDIFADQTKEDLPSNEGTFFKDDLLPNSLEYYLNIMDDFEDDEDEDDEDEEDEDEDDEDDEEDGAGKKKAVKAKKPEAKGEEAKKECKNQ